MSIIPVNLNKEFPDMKFIIVENNNIEPIKFSMEYNSIPPRLKSIGRINTIYEMHDLMSRSLQILSPLKTEYYTPTSNSGLYENNNFNIDSSIQDYGIFFAPDFPDFLIPKNIPEYKSSPQVIRNAITWGIVRQEPGTVSQDIPFRGVRELKARTRDFIVYYGEKDKTKIIGSSTTNIKGINEKIGYMRMRAQVFDNLVQYNIWGKTNYEVEHLTEWFIGEYMDNYIGMFREGGIVNMYYDRRVRDDTLNQMKNGYHLRSVLYYIRTERIKPEFIGPINQITLNISVENLQNLLNREEDYSIESEHDKLISRWIQRNQLGG